MQSIQQTFYRAFDNDYVNPQDVENFTKKHPYLVNGTATVFSNCIEGGVGYLIGRLANVSNASCAGIIVVSNIIRQIILSIIAFNTDWKNPKAFDNYKITNVLISGFIAGLTAAHLYNLNLIGPMGMMAFLVYTTLKKSMFVVLYSRTPPYLEIK